MYWPGSSSSSPPESSSPTNDARKTIKSEIEILIDRSIDTKKEKGGDSVRLQIGMQIQEDELQGCRS